MIFLLLWMFGLVGCFVARWVWNLEFGRQPLTWGNLLLFAVVGVTVFVPWLAAAIWGGCYFSSGSRIAKALKRPVFKR